MRSTIEPADRPLPPLGAPIREEKPAPAPTPTGTPGILRTPDGRLVTDLPLPKESQAAPVMAPKKQETVYKGLTMLIDGVRYRQERSLSCSGCAFRDNSACRCALPFALEEFGHTCFFDTIYIAVETAE